MLAADAEDASEAIFLLHFSPFQDILRLFCCEKFVTKLILLDSLLQEVWRTTGQVLGLRALHLLPASCIGPSKQPLDESERKLRLGVYLKYRRAPLKTTTIEDYRGICQELSRN
jgi:hypothetical protein